MKMFHALVSIVMIASVFSCTGFASFISLTSQADSVYMTVNMSVSNISLSNSGDEAANNVRLSLILPKSFSTSQIYAGRILPNSTFSGYFNITATSAASGTYIAAILTEYQDANGYEFSSVSPLTVMHQTSTRSKLRVSMESTELGVKGTGKLSVKLANSDSADRSANISLFLPNEITATQDIKTVTIGKGSEQTIDFDITNQGALAGSTYAIFATADYDDSVHYSSFIVGTISIIKESENQTNWLLIIAVVLIVAVIAINFGYRFLKK